MCTLAAGAMFKHKRAEYRRLKFLLEILKHFPETSPEFKARNFVRVRGMVFRGMDAEKNRGNTRGVELIIRRAARAGVLIL